MVNSLLKGKHNKLRIFVSYSEYIPPFVIIIPLLKPNKQIDEIFFFLYFWSGLFQIVFFPKRPLD